MDQSAGWVICEDVGVRDMLRRLVSVRPAHKSCAAVARVMEQM